MEGLPDDDPVPRGDVMDEFKTITKSISNRPIKEVLTGWSQLNERTYYFQTFLKLSLRSTDVCVDV